jgi:hypothetical protein
VQGDVRRQSQAPSLPRISLRNRRQFLTPRYFSLCAFAIQTFHLVAHSFKIAVVRLAAPPFASPPSRKAPTSYCPGHLTMAGSRSAPDVE